MGGMPLIGKSLSRSGYFFKGFESYCTSPFEAGGSGIGAEFFADYSGSLGMRARFGIVAFPPISRILCFFVSLDFLKRLF